MDRKIKVAIVTNLVPHYRQNFYDRLSQDNSLDITIFCQSYLPGFNLESTHHKLPFDVVEMSFWGISRERLTWQFSPIRRLWQTFDVYVFYGNPRVVSNVVWATLFKWLGKPVIIWGQGHTAGANPLTEKIRLRWWRTFDFIFVYTDREAQELQQCGFANKIIFGMNNGLDQEKIDKASARWPRTRLTLWQQEQAIDHKIILLSVARLEPKNQFELVIKTLPILIKQFPDLLWCVIGDGGQKDHLQNLAEQLNVTHHIRWLGATYEEDALAPWFLSAGVMVHPGAIGLSLLHAFGYGLPVITHNNLRHHMPEIVALQNGKNGLLFDEGDVTSLCQQITAILKNVTLQQSLGQNALKVAQTQYNTQVMVERFVEIVKLSIYS